MKKILIIGANGMLGSTFCNYLSKFKDYQLICISRKKLLMQTQKIVNYNFDLSDYNLVYNVIKKHKPSFVINCAGKVKKLVGNDNLIDTYFINSVFPHILSSASQKFKFILIHFSTDCVFDGKKGNYKENDICNAKDNYGLSKILGETDPKYTIIFRTSIIGHEQGSNKRGLLCWFLNQRKQILGFKKAIFSGLPTIEIAEIVKKYIIEKKVVSYGIYNIASQPITKYDLLKKIAKIYKKQTKIKLDYSVKINRSLNGKKFNRITKYKPPSWDKLIKKMYKFK